MKEGRGGWKNLPPMGVSKSSSMEIGNHPMEIEKRKFNFSKKK